MTRWYDRIQFEDKPQPDGEWRKKTHTHTNWNRTGIKEQKLMDSDINVTAHGRWWCWSETKLYSAWSASASFTPCHTLRWTEDAQHAQILWETLVFSNFTLNPHRHSFITTRCPFGCLYVKAHSGIRCVCNFAITTKILCFLLQIISKAEVTYVLCHFRFTCTQSHLIQKPSKPFGPVCQ